jgi:hypothetical protein
MTLRLIILLFGVGALIAQFFLSVHEDRAKQNATNLLQTKLKRIEDGINELVSQGKLASSDARNLLVIAETVHFQENLQIEVKPGSDKK